MVSLQRERRLAEVVDQLVDDQVGILRFVREVTKEPGGPDFFHFSGKACDTSAFSPLRNFSFTGGASSQREIALGKAIGEGVERYCAAIYDPEELPLCSYAEADFAAARPSTFALFSAEQYAAPGFPWLPFDDQTSVRWVPARDLGTGESVHVPACRVFIPYHFPAGSDDAPIDQPISTGLACHLGWASAASGAICEAVERDSALLAWQAMIQPAQLRIETLSEANYDLVARFERTGASVRILDLTLDTGIPTVMAVLTNPNPEAAALVFAPATSPDPEVAVRKALEELAHTRRYCQHVKSNAPRLVPDPPEYRVVMDQQTHLNFYVDHDNVHLTDFLFASDKRVEFDELPNIAEPDAVEGLKRLVERVESVGEKVFAVDLTTPDVEELGLAVVRVVIPGFQQLHMGFHNRCLGGSRLWTVPQHLGHPGVSPETGDNPAPHPYP